MLTGTRRPIRPIMKKFQHLALLLLLAVSFGCKPKPSDSGTPNGPTPPPSGQPSLQMNVSPAVTETKTLSNGIQAGVVYYPGSTNFFVFTFLPQGLTADGAGEALCDLHAFLVVPQDGGNVAEIEGGRIFRSHLTC